MQIIIRPMTEEEVWQFILKRHESYHTNLKNFGYGFSNFIPRTESIYEMFSKETLSEQDIKKYREAIAKIYDAEKLKRLDGIFDSGVKPKIINAAKNVLSPLLSSWGAVLPEKLEILCTYGDGGSYYVSEDGKYAQIVLRMSRMKEDEHRLFGLLMHEFIHILIQRQIISKYHVPQDLKERIVDIIGLELFQKPVQSKFEDSFANAYITPETIKTDLPGAVKKMMADYTVLQQKQAAAKFMEQYEPLKEAKEEIQKQINDLYSKDPKANLTQINELVDKSNTYKSAIIKLINEGSEKAFKEYAKKLFDMSLYVIGKNLSGSAIKFDKLSADEKLSFAQEFINNIASRFHVDPIKIVYEKDMPENMFAAYDFDKTIKINRNNIGQKIVNLQFLIGAILHEFTHYLYVKHPSKTPVGEQKVAAVMENFIPDSPNGICSQKDLDAYKQRPFEAPAYYVQDYFEKYKFYEQLLTLISQTPDHER